MTDRPRIRKALFTYEADERLVAAVKDSLPETVVIVASSEDELRRCLLYTSDAADE